MKYIKFESIVQLMGEKNIVYFLSKYNLAVYLLILLQIPSVFLFSQCPTANFTIEPPSCTDQSILITNSSSAATNFNWDFCSGDFEQPIDTFYNYLGNFNTPSCALPYDDGLNKMVFVCSRSGNKVYRVDFTNGFNNPATQVTDILNTNGPNGIAIIYENGLYYGLVVNVFSSSITKFEFGASLLNVGSNISTIINSGLNLPRGIDFVVDQFGNKVIVVANFVGNYLSVFNFGNSINNSSTNVSTINLNGSGVIDVSLGSDCNNWYAFTACYNSGDIYRTDFGSSILNANPTSQSIYSGLGNISGITVLNDNSKWLMCLSNYTSNNLIKLNIGDSLNSSSLSLLGNDIIGTGNPMGINFLKIESNWFGFVSMESTNALNSILLENPCSVNFFTSVDSIPANIFYSTNGLFNVTLEVSDSLNIKNYQSRQITINSSPVTNFLLNGYCLGSLSSFSDASTIVSGTIANYHWNFGDGDTSSQKNPVHTFQDTGHYQVMLLTEATSGCVDSIIKSVFISPSPDSKFYTPAGCSDTPLPFSDSSTVISGSIQSWFWNFDDGNTDTLQNPVHTYLSGSQYNVSLTVTTDSGCADTDSVLIDINHSPDGMFSATNTCIGQLTQFVDESTTLSTIVSYQWHFGDGDSSSATNPTHSYPAFVNTYPVSLIVEAANGCTDTVNKNIKVNNIPSASFIYTPVNACENNVVAFTDLSSVAGDTINRWLWSFGDGFNDTVQHPTHVFDSAATYTVSLNVYSPTSCGTSISQNIAVIESPVAVFSYTPVCIGSQTQFSDLSTAPSGSTVTGYFWDFGDGDTSTVQNPTHTYANPGNFQVILTIETNFGCTDQDTMTVTVYPQPVAGFTHGNTCSIYPVSFTSTSTAPSPYSVSSYLWNFGDPASGPNNSSSQQAPSHSFADTGIYVVSLIAISDVGCTDTAFDVLTINPSSVPNFQYTPTCYGDLVSFTNLTTPPSLDTAWHWNFGDGQTTILQNPAHFYAFPGNYTVTLTVTAMNGCVSYASKPVSVSPIPVANFSVTPICLNTPYQFIDQSSISSGSIVSWKWIIADFDSSTLQNPYFTFTDTGTYSVTLVVTSDIGCTKSINKSARVYPLPVANFQFNPQYGNPPLNVTFINLSAGANSFQWNFGDGGQSTLSNPTHTYQDTGNFPIKLISQSIYGCIDTVDKSIYVIKPLIDIALNNISHTIQNNYLYITAEVSNLGTRDILNFKITAEIEDGSRIRETYNGLLPNGSSGIMQYNFNAAFELPQGKTIQYYCVTISEPNGETDQVPSNDKRCNSLDNSYFFKDPFPNPFTNNIAVEVILPFSGNCTIDLFDQTGKLVQTIYDGAGNKGLNTFRLYLPFLSEGLYSIRCLFADETVVKQIVKITPQK